MYIFEVQTWRQLYLLNHHHHHHIILFLTLEQETSFLQRTPVTGGGGVGELEGDFTPQLVKLTLIANS